MPRFNCAVLTDVQGAWEILSAYSTAGTSLEDGNVAAVAAQSFWDYAQQTDRALPGVRQGAI